MEFYKVNNGNQVVDYSGICTRYFGCKEVGFVVDVGAHEGYSWSNSYPLIMAGWSGLLIEPHPTFVGKIRETYKDLASNRITIVEKAMSNYKGEAILYDAGSLTTLKPAMLDAYAQIEWAKGENQNRTFIVNVDKLNDVLRENNVKPNFEVFTLDVEGSEEEVLECFDINYWKPQMAVIETLEGKEDWERTILDMKDGNFYKFCDELFIKNGYTKIYSDTINTIYTL